MKLQGRVVVVTGAGRGLGEAYARRAALEGAAVAVSDISLEAATAVADEIAADGGRAVGVEMDVRSWDSVRAGAAAVEADLGPVDGLVNNAGISLNARAEELPEEWWDAVIDVGLNGTWRCCQVFGKAMVDRGRGAIVNIGSAYSEVGTAGRASYATTKTGVVGLTRVLGVEWAPFGVRVNLVQPGYIDTPMLQVALASTTPELLLGRLPIGRFGEADEVAKAVAFLLSDEASYITATTLRVDGGHLSYGGMGAATVRPAAIDELRDR